MIDPRYALARERLRSIGRVLLVGSGKGGVGKSLVAASLALKLAEQGYRVGLLDLDLHGPTAQLVLGARAGELAGTRFGLVPVEARGVLVYSLSFLVGDGPLPFKGPAKESLVLDLASQVNWGSLDALVVDLPPGTGDEVVTALRVFREKGLVLVVTTPSVLSLGVVRRLVELLRDEGVGVLGVVENMAYVRCGGAVVEPFGPPKAERLGLDLLARLPLDPEVEELLERGEPPTLAAEFGRAVEKLAREVARRSGLGQSLQTG